MRKSPRLASSISSGRSSLSRPSWSWRSVRKRRDLRREWRPRYRGCDGSWQNSQLSAFAQRRRTQSPASRNTKAQGRQFGWSLLPGLVGFGASQTGKSMLQGYSFQVQAILSLRGEPSSGPPFLSPLVSDGNVSSDGPEGCSSERYSSSSKRGMRFAHS